MTIPFILRKAFTIAAIGASLVYPMYTQNSQGHIEFAIGARVQKELSAALGNKGAVLTGGSRTKISDTHYLRLVDALAAYDEERQYRASPGFKSRIAFSPDMKLLLSDAVNRPAFYRPDERALPVFLNPIRFE